MFKYFYLKILTRSFDELFNAKAAKELPLKCNQMLFFSHISLSLEILSQCPVITEPASAKTNRGVTTLDCESSAKRRSNAEISMICREPNIVL